MSRRYIQIGPGSGGLRYVRLWPRYRPNGALGRRHVGALGALAPSLYADTQTEVDVVDPAAVPVAEQLPVAGPVVQDVLPPVASGPAT